MSIPVDKHVERKFDNELSGLRPDDDYLSTINAPWPGCTAVSVASYSPGEELLDDPNNFHSNPGYMGTSTASSLGQSAPGGMYRTAGPRGPSVSYQGGRQGHRPMATGGATPIRVPGRTVLPASSAREPVSEGSPLVVSTGGAGW
jgi:hypothetical protein